MYFNKREKINFFKNNSVVMRFRYIMEAHDRGYLLNGYYRSHDLSLFWNKFFSIRSLVKVAKTFTFLGFRHALISRKRECNNNNTKFQIAGLVNLVIQSLLSYYNRQKQTSRSTFIPQNNNFIDPVFM